jgi:hypothetical protein
MNAGRGALLAATLVLAAACSKPEAPKVDAATEQAEAAKRAREGPYGAQLKALDTAKGLGDDINKKVQESVDKAEK